MKSTTIFPLRIACTLLLIGWAVEAGCQRRRLVVVNAESRVPIRDVKVSIDNGPDFATPWDGSFELPDSFERIHFVAPGFERRYVLRSELRGDTIPLLPIAGSLGEVVVWGRYRFRDRMSTMLQPSPDAERDRLPAYIPPGPDILAIAGWIYSKTLGPKVEARARRKKALKAVRQKEAELEQRWEMLRDTTARK